MGLFTAWWDFISDPREDWVAKVILMVIILGGIGLLVLIFIVIFVVAPEQSRHREAQIAWCETHNYGYQFLDRNGYFCLDDQGRLIRPGGR